MIPVESKSQILRLVGLSCHMDLEAKTNFSEEHTASIFRVEHGGYLHRCESLISHKSEVIMHKNRHKLPSTEISRFTEWFFVKCVEMWEFILLFIILTYATFNFS
jgi:hypothetical protein